jgi:hypothetical protein
MHYERGEMLTHTEAWKACSKTVNQRLPWKAHSELKSTTKDALCPQKKKISYQNTVMLALLLIFFMDLIICNNGGVIKIKMTS